MMNPRTVERDLTEHVAKRNALSFDQAKELMKKEVYAIMWNELLINDFDAKLYYDCIQRLNLKREYGNHLFYLANYYYLNDDELQDFLFAYKDKWELADKWNPLKQDLDKNK